LNFTQQYYLCYYRDGVLINNSKIARTPYSFTAQNTTISGLIIDSNLSLGTYNFSASSIYGNLYGAWNGSSDYYLKTNPYSFWNSTFATFNKTYADTLYYGINNPFGYFNTTTLSGAITGSGTSWYIPMWNGTTSLNNSLIYQNGTYIGIGTTAPGVALDVLGTISASSNVLATNSIQATGYMATPYMTPYTSGGNLDFRNYAGDTSYLSVNTTSGYVGVGTTAPVKKLDVVGDANITGSIYETGTSLGAKYYNLTNPYGYWNSTFATFNKTYADTLYYGINNPFGYYNSTTLSGSGTVNGSGTLGYIPMWNGTTSLNNSLIYQYSGKIGINNTSPSATLNVNGTFKAEYNQGSISLDTNGDVKIGI